MHIKRQVCIAFVDVSLERISCLRLILKGVFVLMLQSEGESYHSGICCPTVINGQTEG
jgi:hypothetical protein